MASLSHLRADAASFVPAAHAKSLTETTSPVKQQQQHPILPLPTKESTSKLNNRSRQQQQQPPHSRHPRRRHRHRQYPTNNTKEQLSCSTTTTTTDNDNNSKTREEKGEGEEAGVVGVRHHHHYRRRKNPSVFQRRSSSETQVLAADPADPSEDTSVHKATLAPGVVHVVATTRSRHRPHVSRRVGDTTASTTLQKEEEKKVLIFYEPQEELWRPNDPTLFPTLASCTSTSSSPLSSMGIWSQNTNNVDRLRDGLLLRAASAASHGSNNDNHSDEEQQQISKKKQSSEAKQQQNDNLVRQPSGLTLLNKRKKRSSSSSSSTVLSFLAVNTIATNTIPQREQLPDMRTATTTGAPPLEPSVETTSTVFSSSTNSRDPDDAYGGLVVVVIDDDEDDNCNIDNNTQQQRRRRLDMARLRDRWWDTLQKHHQRAQETINTNEEESSSGESSSSSSDTSSLLLPVVRLETTVAPSWLEQTQQQTACPANNNGNTVVLLEPIYCNVSSPVHEAIRRGDEFALRELLRRRNESKTCQEKPNSTAAGAAAAAAADDDDVLLCLSPIQLAVQLDRPRLLRILFKENNSNSSSSCSTSSAIPPLITLPPLLLAAEMGHDECLRLLIVDSCCTSSALLVKDPNDNNVLHVCCRSEAATASTLRTILLCTSTSSLLLSKLFQSRNKCGQTPLHVACQQGRSTMVEAILSSNLSFALLSKLLIQQDNSEQTPLLAAVASGSTDVVMSLLMWRGNNHTRTVTTTTTTATATGAGANQTSPCPLTWAVHLRNVDMALLLLEFNDPSGHGYDLVKSLRVAVTRYNDDNNLRSEDTELIRVLVDAGANPCAIDEGGKSPDASALSIAAKQSDAESIVALLDSYESYLQRVRGERRRDPVLRKQPESFFAGIESQENAQRYSGLRDALVTCLFCGYQSGDFASPYYTCCDLLYRRGAQLGFVGLLRLKGCLTTSVLLSAEAQPNPRNLFCNYQAQYAIVMANEVPLPNYWSLVMLQMPWMEIDSDMDCWRLIGGRSETIGVHVPDTDVVLVCEDGTRFVAHSTILALKSEKLAAAIRFASMAGGTSQRFEIPVASYQKIVVWMLHHIYHGSLVVGESNLEDPSLLAHNLLELLLLAEEFLCPTLIQECEMRLLSSEPQRCFCGSCAVTLNASTCVYRVHGPSFFLELPGPSALDILAVTQQVAHNGCLDGSYNIDLSVSESPVKLYSSWPKNGIAVQPLVSLRDAAVCSLLLNWALAIDRPDFQSQVLEQTGGFGLVLHSCMDELAYSPITNVSKRNQLGPTVDLTKVECKSLSDHYLARPMD